MRHGADLKAHVSNTFSQYNHPAPNLQLRYPYARELVHNRFNGQQRCLPQTEPEDNWKTNV